MHFNSVSVKYIGTFDADKNETKHKIEKLDDIYRRLISSERPCGYYPSENSKRHIQMKQNLGSGLIIPNEVKTGYTEDMEVSHAYPVLPFRKPDGTDQPFLSPLTVSPVPMTGTSSAAFFTLSNMDFSGRMPLRNMVRTRRCTIGSSG